MPEQRIDLRYRPGGPVLAAFMASRARVQGIMGPIGSGKTQGALIKFPRLGAAQRPSTRDGVRRVKFCVVRDTYRQLWNTTIPSWFKRIPKDAGEWVGALGDPARHKIEFRLGDGSMVELGMEFVAIGDNKVEDVLRGYEVTGFYLNEADLLSREVLTYAISRAGRYPDIEEGGPSWYGVLADFNAPDTENYCYDFFVDNPPDGVEFFRQPSGLSPNAENLSNLPPGYYADLVAINPDWWVRRMVRNEFGYSRDGKPVYPEFSDGRHVAPEPLKPVRGVPLIVGADAGGTPAAALTQRLPGGQWRVYDEIVFDGGATRFGELLNQKLAEPEYRELDVAGWCDPAALAQGTDEKSWCEIVSHVTKIRFRAAPSNRLLPRLEAVRVPLLRSLDGATPGFLLSPTCKMLRKGFNSGYRYRRLQVAGGERYVEEPDKNEYSHPHDALQYALSGGGEHATIRGRDQAWRNQARQTQAIDFEHPEGEFVRGPDGRQAYAISE